ncbi:MAG TPA: 4Fe-4S binding protein [Methanoregula sp.]|nr:4Fe-4S binding protein [Methanoregula sp.]
MDEFLKTFVDKYDNWRKSEQFTYSSKIIPIGVSFEAKPWLLPQEQVLKVLQDARSFALTDCICRTHYTRCGKPREVCLLIDEMSEKAVERGKARRITLAEASEVLKKADEHGLVHMTLYKPGRKIYALCSCCACCCHDLQLLMDYNRRDLVARSDYVAVTDRERCTGCGRCIERCIFSARSICDGIVELDAGSCLGCGLCVSICPEKATVMTVR